MNHYDITKSLDFLIFFIYFLVSVVLDFLEVLEEWGPVQQ